LSKGVRPPTRSKPNSVEAAFELDSMDKQILNVLQDDARISIAELSRLVGLGETAIRYRISRMMKANVITKFTALLSPREIGYTVSAIIILKVEARMHVKKHPISSRHQANMTWWR